MRKILINEKGKVVTMTPKDSFYQKGKYIKVSFSVKSLSALIKQSRQFKTDIVMEVPRIPGRPIIFVAGELKVAMPRIRKQATFNWPKRKN